MAATATNGAILTAQTLFSTRSVSSAKAGPSLSTTHASSFMGAQWTPYLARKKKTNKISRNISAAAVVEAPPFKEIKEFVLPSWADFDLGRASVYWKTMNGLPPTSVSQHYNARTGERLRIFYNPAATNLVPDEEFGIAFNGGFNQPIMCGGEPRAMRMKSRGKADAPIYSIQICIPKHAVNLIFSFTNGSEWDGPYRLQFQVPRSWQNKPITFFNEGLAQELSNEGACDRAIFPDTNIVAKRCTMIGNLTVEGGDRCNLDLVLGCLDPSSHLYDPLANVDDGSCSIEFDSE